MLDTFIRHTVTNVDVYQLASRSTKVCDYDKMVTMVTSWIVNSTSRYSHMHLGIEYTDTAASASNMVVANYLPGGAGLDNKKKMKDNSHNELYSINTFARHYTPDGAIPSSFHKEIIEQAGQHITRLIFSGDEDAAALSGWSRITQHQLLGQAENLKSLGTTNLDHTFKHCSRLNLLYIRFLILADFDNHAVAGSLLHTALESLGLEGCGLMYGPFNQLSTRLPAT